LIATSESARIEGRRGAALTTPTVTTAGRVPAGQTASTSGNSESRTSAISQLSMIGPLWQEGPPESFRLAGQGKKNDGRVSAFQPGVPLEKNQASTVISLFHGVCAALQQQE